MKTPFELPGTRAQFARDKDYDILHTKLELSFDFVRRSVEGVATHKLKILRDVDRIDFDAANLKIKNIDVFDHDDNAKSTASEFEVSPKKLLIHLNRTVEVGNFLSVRIEYCISNPKIGLHFRGLDNDTGTSFVHCYTTGLLLEDPMYYFPCYNYPNMRMTSETVVTAPSHMTAIAAGELVSITDLPNHKAKKWHFKMDRETHITDVLSVVVGEYAKLEEWFGTIPVEYYFPRGRESGAKRSFSKTPEMMKFFSEKTGTPYPYAKYAQVVVSDFYNGGMEHVTATTLTDETLQHDEREEEELGFSESDDLVSHELAHQWFGDLISLKDWSHAWVNEAFATYFNALYREHDRGADDFLYYMLSLLEKLKEEIEKHYERSVVTRYYVDSHELFDSHTYLKGAWVIHGIRGVVGDHVFWSVIKHYVKENKGRIVETSDFRRSLELVSGFDFERHFEEWLYSPGYPIYQARYSWLEEEKTAIVELEQTNAGTGGVPLFSNPIEICFDFSPPPLSKLRKVVSMKHKRERFEFHHLPSQPQNVTIDPKNWLLKELQFKKPLSMWIFQALNGENVIEKIRACEQIAEKHDEDDRTALEILSSLADRPDEFWGVRLETVRNLGKLDSKSSFEKLYQLAHNNDRFIRRGAASGLKAFSSNADLREDAVRLLIELLENDVSFRVRAAAASSLGSYRGNKNSIEALKKASTQDSLGDILRAAAFKALGEIGDVDSAQAMLDYFLHGNAHQGRIAAVKAFGELSKNNSHTAETILAARDFADARIRMEAANVLALIGSRDDLKPLATWLEVEPEGRVRRRIREAMYSIEQKDTIRI